MCWPVVAGTILACTCVNAGLVVCLVTYARTTGPALAAAQPAPAETLRPDEDQLRATSASVAPAAPAPLQPALDRPPASPAPPPSGPGALSPEVGAPVVAGTTVCVQDGHKPAPSDAPVPLTEEWLQEQLRRVPEINLPELDDLRDLETAYAKARGMGLAGDTKRDPSREYRIAQSLEQLLLQGREAGLPIRIGPGCALSPKAAETLGRGAVDLRWPSKIAGTSGQATMMTAPLSRTASGQVSLMDKQTGKTVMTFQGLPRSGLRRVDDLRQLFEVTWPGEKVEKSCDVVPVLTQVLQVESPAYRQLLVEELDRIPGPEASQALARRALYDTSPDLRQEAIVSLKKRPTAEYQGVVLDGFRYPWAPVADHAADVLVQTRDVQAIPKLVELLDRSDPALARLNERTQKVEIRELVRLNHLRNCCLCHAPSYSSSDWVPGRVMEPGVELPVEYYGSPNGAFVRADITYLRQDFSTMQRVENAKPWPELQRYDYLVRTRPATAEEIGFMELQPADASYPQREAVLHALQKLSGQDLGPSAAAWQKYLAGIQAREVTETAGSRVQAPAADRPSFGPTAGQ